MNYTPVQPNEEGTAPKPARGVAKWLNPAGGVQYRNEYLRLSTTLTYSYLFVLPLILLYEAGVWFLNSGSVTRVRIGADVMVKRFFSLIGIDDTWWLAIILILVGGAIYLYERNKNVPLRPAYFGFMFAESLVYALVLGTLIAIFVGSLFTIVPPLLQVAGEPAESLFRGIVLSLGAGVYEELIFRLILVTLLYAVLNLVEMDDRVRYILAAVIGAIIFSGVHYTGALGDTFTLSSFTFRFLMGLALNVLFLLRGFGIAAMTHALYDVYVTLM